MSFEWPYPQEQHQARVIAGDPQANAYAWIEAYANQLSRPPSPDNDDDYGYGVVTAEELIETGLNNVDNGSWDDYISKGPLFEGVSTDPMFWDKLAIFMKIKIPEEVQGSNFFSCSC